jgi:sulfate adenylyltransferase
MVLFTGLSGSGKSTLARDLAAHVLERTPRTVSLLDGDDVRRLLSSGLGFDHAARDLNVRRIGFVGSEIARHGGLAVCAPIAPYAESRAAVRAMVEPVGDFVLVHVSTSLAECERRDLKGLYARARAGLISEFTGISDPYDVPTDADLVVDTAAMSREEALNRVLDLLHERGLVVEDTEDDTEDNEDTP